MKKQFLFISFLASILFVSCSFFVTVTNITLNNKTEENLLIYIDDETETKTITLKANTSTSVILKPNTIYTLTIYDSNSIYGDSTYYQIKNCQTTKFSRFIWSIVWNEETKVYELEYL